MQVDVLIIGQGICGTMLSWFLHKEGKTFFILDNNQPTVPSKVAPGVINPVTGRRYSYTWMIDTIMPFAHKSYTDIGAFLDKKIIHQKDIIDFFPSAQMRDAFATGLLVAGVALELLACLGAALMREPLDRLHYAGVAPCAAICLAAGVVVRDSFSLLGNKAILLAALGLVVAWLAWRSRRDRRGRGWISSRR